MLLALSQKNFLFLFLASHWIYLTVYLKQNQLLPLPFYYIQYGKR